MYSQRRVLLNYSLILSGIIFYIPELVSSKYHHHVKSSEEYTPRHGFWDGVRGAEHVSILDSENIDHFIRDNTDSFVMFYAHWCGASKRARGEFARAALELAYTEGFSDIAFGAFDCNATEANKYICKEVFEITKYPRFIYFKNGKYDRLYTVQCPRIADFFYNWVVNNGNERYCAGSSEAAKIFALESSATSILHPAGSFMCYFMLLVISTSIMLRKRIMM